MAIFLRQNGDRGHRELLYSTCISPAVGPPRSLLLENELKNLIAVMAVAVLMPALPTAPAKADSAEDVYISTLDATGVPYSNRAAAIQFRQVICKALRGGTSVATLVDMTTSDGVYSRVQANSIIGAADGALCPEVNLPPN
jgi:hypothetical protein